MNFKSLLLSSLIVISLVFGSNTVFAQDVDKTPKVVKKTVEDLLNDLGNDDYDIRESATMKLAERGAKDKTIYEQIKKLNKKTSDPEVKSRTNFLLQKLNPSKPPKSVDRSKDKPKRIVPPRRNNVPGMPEMPEIPGLKDLDFGKLFGGKDMDNAFEQLGIPKDLVKTLKKVMAGEELDPQKLLEEYLKGSQPKAKGPERELKKPVKNVKPNPKDPKFFGIRWGKPSKLKAKLFGTEKEGGIVVLEVVKGTYADKAGLEQGDVILAVKGKPVGSAAAFEALKDGGGEVIVARSEVNKKPQRHAVIKRVKLKFPKWNAPKKSKKTNGDF